MSEKPNDTAAEDAAAASERAAAPAGEAPTQIPDNADTRKISRDDMAELEKFEGKPSVRSTLPIALCHVFAMLVGNITPAMLISASLGLSAADETTLVQASMIVAGLSTLLQVWPVLKCGMGLPTVMGVSFAYIPVLTSIGLSHGLAGVFGAQLAAGFIMLVLGLLIEKIRKFFPPIVTGTVVLAIGLSLYSTAVNYMGGGSAAKTAGTFGSPEFLILAGVTLVVTLACGFLGKGLIKVSGMMVGIAVGFVLAIFMGNGLVDFSSLASSSWLSLPRPLGFGIEFYPDAILLMLLLNVVQAVQMVGGTESTTVGAYGRAATANELGGAIKGQGVASIVGALFGGLPTSVFNQNTGLICTSKIVARRVFVAAAAIMIACGICPKFSAFVSCIPLSVVGGATVTVFAIIAVSGIETICEQPLTYRNKIIVGLSLALGMGIGSVPEILQFLPEIVQEVFGSSLAVSFIFAFLLNILIPEGEQDRAKQM
jgi:uracil-xanthine permease